MTIMELTKYKSHKIVEAGEITQVDRYAVTVRVASGAEEILRLPSAMFVRYTPVVGDYLVRYDTGTAKEYLSFSPRDVFIAGYTALAEA